MAAETERSVWSHDFGPVPAGCSGILLRFAASRTGFAFDRAKIQMPPGAAARRAEVAKGPSGVLVRWARAEAGDVRLTIPFAGVAPEVMDWEWLVPRWHRGTATAPDAAEGAAVIPGAQPDPDRGPPARAARTGVLQPTRPTEEVRGPGAASEFFAELDAATNPRLLGTAGSTVTPERVALVVRETNRLQSLLIGLGAAALRRADPPQWGGAKADRDAVVDIMLPLLDEHFGAGARFDPARLASAFYSFAAGELRKDPSQPSVRAPDAANILCFAGFALRAATAPRPSATWSKALPYLVRAACVYFACAPLRTEGRWSSYGAPSRGRPADIEELFRDHDLPLGPRVRVIDGLARLIVTMLPDQIRDDYPRA